QIKPGVSYSPAMGKRKVGLNIALGDLDEKEKGAGNFGNFHHEDWLAGRKNTRTNKIEWGSLWIFPGPYRQYHCRRCASRPGPWLSGSRCPKCPQP
ncbi:MAG: hypothetical protein N2512_09510, partial [Armatimonadetes bacterium]|nr:hypothetical protein [Armatimonadota bacterium]